MFDISFDKHLQYLVKVWCTVFYLPISKDCSAGTAADMMRENPTRLNISDKWILALAQTQDVV